MAGEWPRQDPILPRKWFGFEHVSILDNKVPTIFRQRHLARLRLVGEIVVEEEPLLDGFGRRIRDVRVGPDGALWLVTGHDPGQVLRLDPLD